MLKKIDAFLSHSFLGLFFTSVTASQHYLKGTTPCGCYFFSFFTGFKASQPLRVLGELLRFHQNMMSPTV